ncbi:Uma2 family endonuclease [Jiangella alkaliphila]|uniref:Endonuclease, Uma2 family (Restriction endonuclease fold) n=1 Tax=Jiangella alkaliphila TaxID=419479 RepID=A0A1H2INB7_9ACTN|nr:Uma2 family endonuclease [Jiangella alkaliphila]SDU45647.1 Endonuclease, Uma2 family (restriction endonuclease fold) [Jiangella alkaliphila]
MTTVTVPNELLTIEDWDALEETDTNRYWELVDGTIVMNAFPSAGHQLVAHRLATRLDVQLPDGLVALQHIGVTIEAQFPPTERGPDVVVFPRARAHLDVPRIDPVDVRLVVEVVSPGSRRTDRIAKVADYQYAGIPGYWIIDPAADDDSRFVAYELVGGAYKEVARGSGVITLERPFPVTIDVDALLTFD